MLFDSIGNMYFLCFENILLFYIQLYCNKHP